MATTVAPFSAAISICLSLPPGLKKLISVCPLRIRRISVSVGWRTLAITSQAFHRAAALLSTSTPAAL